MRKWELNFRKDWSLWGLAIYLNFTDHSYGILLGPFEVELAKDYHY
jgi:hypothetical protein